MSENFFNNINSEAQAYLLGFYVADGNLYKYKTQQIRMKIAISIKDIEILEYFKKYIYPKANINITKSKVIKFHNKEYKCNPMSIFTINSNILGQSLINYGYGYRKTGLNIRLPKIPTQLIHHFIRGYFDGDGTISYTIGIRKKGRGKGDSYFNHYVSFVSFTSYILKDIKNVTKFHNINFKLNPHKIKYSGLTISSIKDILYFYNYLYWNANLYLKRKKEKFETIIELRKNFIREHRVPNRLKALFGM